jgi:hypothetical protein
MELLGKIRRMHVESSNSRNVSLGHERPLASDRYRETDVAA